MIAPIEVPSFKPPNLHKDGLAERIGLRYPSGPVLDVIGPFSVLTTAASSTPTLAYTLKVVGSKSYSTLNLSKHKTSAEAAVAYRLLGPGDHRGAILSGKHFVELAAPWI
jgi:hypothetical protein